MQTQIWGALKETWDRFQRDDGSLMAAATAFYAGLSLIPLLLVLISGLGILLGTTQFGIDAKQEILAAIESEASPVIRTQVEKLLENLTQGAAVNGPLGLAGLLIGGMAVFAQFERAFDRIWNVEEPQDIGVIESLKRILLLRFRAFLMMCSLALLVLTVFIAGLTIDTLEAFTSRWWPVPPLLRRLTEWGVSMAINTLVFLILYRFLPKVEVRWSEAFKGALLVAVFWEIGRQVLAAVLIRSNYISAYGTIGSFLAILLWLYYASHLVFLGAEFVQHICQKCDV